MYVRMYVCMYIYIHIQTRINYGACSKGFRTDGIEKLPGSKGTRFGGRVQ